MRRKLTSCVDLQSRKHHCGSLCRVQMVPRFSDVYEEVVPSDRSRIASPLYVPTSLLNVVSLPEIMS